MLHHRLTRSVSLIASLALVHSACGAGLVAAATHLSETTGHLLTPPLPPYTQRPGPVYKGPKPGRDPHRNAWWTPQLREDYARHRLEERLERGEVYAALGEFALMQGGPSDDGGGSGPGEGSGPGGGSGSGGGGMSNSGMSGQSNTNTGNKLSALPLLSVPARGDLNLGLTLYHSSLTTFDGAFGKGWSHSYEANVAYTAGSSAILRMPDGLTLPYTETGGAFVRPSGWNATLVKNAGNTFTLTFKDQHKWEFDASGRLTAVKDRVGNALTVARNGSGQITTVTDPNGRQITFAYHASGRVQTVTDPVGRQWSFAQNGSGQLTDVTYPSIGGPAAVRQFTYNATHDVLTETDLRGKVWTWTYDASERVKTVKNPLNQTTTYTYNTADTTIQLPDGETVVHNYSSGLLASAVDQGGFSDARTYNANRDVTGYTDKRGKAWVFTYDSMGNRLTSKNPLNKTATYTYNATNDVLTVTNALGKVWEHTYNGAGLLATVEDPLNRTTTLGYDSYGQLTSVEDPLSRDTLYEYNPNGDRTKITDPGSVQTTFGYDGLGNPATVTDANSNQTTVGYDAWRRPTSVTRPGGASATTEYDREGHVTKTTDETSRTNEWTYDDAGRLSTHKNGVYDVETYGRDALGRVTTVTNGRGKIRTYTLGDRGEPTSLAMPDGTSESWSYDGEGNTTAYSVPQTGGNLVQILYSYDDAGRQTLVDYPTGTDTTFAYDDAGRRTGMTDATGATTWTLDDAGGLTSLAQPNGTTSYLYNAAGQRTKLTESGLGDTTYAYNLTTGRLTSFTNRHSETTSLQYDARGLVSRKTFSPGQYEEYGYDARGRLQSARVRNSSGTSLRLQTYGYDLADRVTSHDLAGVNTTYTYDGAGQLLTENRSGYAASYTYDANGNRLTRTVNSVTESYAYDDGDKLTGVTGGADPRTYGYDAAGRTTSVVRSSGNTTIGYDQEGRATSITGPGLSASSQYNGLDTRVSHTHNGAAQTFRRDGAHVTAPLLGDGTTTYTPGASLRQGTTSTFLHRGLKNYDSQGNAAQSLPSRRFYDAFGNVTALGGSAWKGSLGYGGPFGYQEDASGLQLLGHRLYDSGAGRFLTRDPAKNGRNWYSYCENDPLNRADPTGHLALVAAAPILAVPVVGEVVLVGAAVIATGYLIWKGIEWISDAVTYSPTKPPFTGNPGDTVVGPRSSRTYAPDGYPLTDRDYNNPGTGHPEDESHDWGRPVDKTPPTHEDRQPGRPPAPGDPPPPHRGQIPSQAAVLTSRGLVMP